MNENFFLYKKTKDFSFEIMEYIKNIPRVYLYLRDDIQNSFSNMVRFMRYYSISLNDSYRVKVKYLKDLVVELSLIDYYLECLYHFGVLGKNRFNVFSKNIEEIRQIAYGVINHEKEVTTEV